jgi:hypothetical protein
MTSKLEFVFQKAARIWTYHMDCESVIKTAFEERHLCSKIPKQPCKVDFCILGRQGKKPDLMQHKMHKNAKWSQSCKTGNGHTANSRCSLGFCQLTWSKMTMAVIAQGQ